MPFLAPRDRKLMKKSAATLEKNPLTGLYEDKRVQRTEEGDILEKGHGLRETDEAPEGVTDTDGTQTSPEQTMDFLDSAVSGKNLETLVESLAPLGMESAIADLQRRETSASGTTKKADAGDDVKQERASLEFAVRNALAKVTEGGEKALQDTGSVSSGPSDLLGEAVKRMELAAKARANFLGKDKTERAVYEEKLLGAMTSMLVGSSNNHKLDHVLAEYRRAGNLKGTASEGSEPLKKIRDAHKKAVRFEDLGTFARSVEGKTKYASMWDKLQDATVSNSSVEIGVLGSAIDTNHDANSNITSRDSNTGTRGLFPDKGLSKVQEARVGFKGATAADMTCVVRSINGEQYYTGPNTIEDVREQGMEHCMVTVRTGRFRDYNGGDQGSAMALTPGHSYMLENDVDDLAMRSYPCARGARTKTVEGKKRVVYGELQMGVGLGGKRALDENERTLSPAEVVRFANFAANTVVHSREFEDPKVVRNRTTGDAEADVAKGEAQEYQAYLDDARETMLARSTGDYDVERTKRIFKEENPAEIKKLLNRDESYMGRSGVSEKDIAQRSGGKGFRNTGNKKLLALREQLSDALHELRDESQNVWSDFRGRVEAEVAHLPTMKSVQEELSAKFRDQTADPVQVKDVISLMAGTKDVVGQALVWFLDGLHFTMGNTRKHVQIPGSKVKTSEALLQRGGDLYKIESDLPNFKLEYTKEVKDNMDALLRKVISASMHEAVQKSHTEAYGDSSNPVYQKGATLTIGELLRASNIVPSGKGVGDMEPATAANWKRIEKSQGDKHMADALFSLLSKGGYMQRSAGVKQAHVTALDALKAAIVRVKMDGLKGKVGKMLSFLDEEGGTADEASVGGATSRGRRIQRTEADVGPIEGLEHGVSVLASSPQPSATLSLPQARMAIASAFEKLELNQGAY